MPETTEPSTVATTLSTQATTLPIETTVETTMAPTTEPTTVPTTVPPETEPAIEYYSEDPVIIEFIDERIYDWTSPLRTEFGEVVGERTFGSSRSNGNRAHAGIDFVAPQGTKVYAITSGTVRRVALFYQSTYAVEVVNDDGSLLRYCEISTSLKAGDRVKQGDEIGTIKRADSGTEMLHMELYYGDREDQLTQTWNTVYTYLDKDKGYMRRPDLMDPTFLKDLKMP